MYMVKTGVSDRTLCRNFCRYYKPDKDEALVCRGYTVVRGIIKRGTAISLDRQLGTALPGKEVIEGLKLAVCSRCDFREADCDYIATNGAAESCGGLLVLLHLLGDRALTIADIEGER